MKKLTYIKQRRRKGSALMEFAIVAPFLITLIAGSFSVGMGLNRAVQARQAVRNANVLMVKDFDLSILDNQRLIVRTAQGLGMENPTGPAFTPNPAGKASIILTKVKHAGAATCNAGIPAWNQNPSSCPNYDQYIIEQRVIIGNTTRWQSQSGTPGVALDSRGFTSAANRATSAGTRATGFPGFLTLALEEYTFLSEMWVDTEDLSMFPIVNPVNIYVRNFS